MSITITTRKDPIVPTVEAIESMQRNVDYWGDRCSKMETEIGRLRLIEDQAKAVIKEWLVYRYQIGAPLCDEIVELGHALDGETNILRATDDGTKTPHLA